jgi:hypothetical protein
VEALECLACVSASRFKWQNLSGALVDSKLKTVVVFDIRKWSLKMQMTVLSNTRASRNKTCSFDQQLVENMLAGDAGITPDRKAVHHSQPYKLDVAR